MGITVIGVIFVLFLLHFVLFFNLTKFFFLSVGKDLQGKPFTTLKTKKFKRVLSAKVRFVSFRDLVYKKFSLFSWLYVSAWVLVFVILVVTASSQYVTSTSGLIINEDPENTVLEKTTPTKLQYIIDGALRLGNENAEIVFVEFGCYTCESASMSLETIREVQEEQSGSLQYYFISAAHNDKEMGLARVASCVSAVAPNNYWAFHSLLTEYDSYKEDYEDLLSELGISKEDVSTCLESTIDDDYLSDLKEFSINHRIGTLPTYFVGDVTITGLSSSEVIINTIKKQTS